MIGRGLLSVQVNAIIESLTDPAVQNETNVTFAVVILSAVLSVCFFIMEIVWKLHWLPYASVTILMAGTPLFGVQLGTVPVILGLGNRAFRSGVQRRGICFPQHAKNHRRGGKSCGKRICERR